MQLLARRKTPAEELKNAAIAALADVLDTEKRAPKPGLTGARAVATGAVIYTAGFAAIKGRRFVREHLSSSPEDEHAEDEFRDEERKDPEGAGYDLDEDVEDEPEAYEDEDEEPEAYEDEPEASEEDDGEPDAYEEDEDEPEANEEDESEPEAYEEDEDGPEASEDDEEPEASGEDEGEPEASDDDEEPGASEDDEAPEASEDDDESRAAAGGGDESSSESPTPLHERKPVRRAARKKGAQPSLKLPRQRRPRLPVSRDRA